MADTEIQALVVKLEADISSFKADLLRGQKAVEDSSKRMADAVDKFTTESKGGFDDFNAIIGATGKLFAAGGVLAVGIKLVGTALDTVFEAENIRAYNNQFEMLARNAGVAGDVLRDGLVKAADGLVDDTDLIKQANASLIAMGSAAKDLPGLMGLARQATAAFGGSASSNFEMLASAVANGNARQLKHLGIVVDQEEAYRKFADKVGLSADQLNQAGKQQALMNAVLERGKEAFKGVDDSILKNQTTWQQFKVTMGQIGEVATLAFEKIAGPTVQTLLSNLKSMSEDAKRAMTASFGEGGEKAQAQVETLRLKLQDLKGAMVDLEQKKLGNVVDFTPGDTASRLAILPDQIRQVTEQLKAAEAQLPKNTEAHRGLSQAAGENADKYLQLKEVQDQFAENGKKLAADLAEFSPETVQKTALEEVKLMREADLISQQDAFALEKVLLQTKLDDEIAMLQAAYAKKKISEVEFQSSVMSAKTKAAADQQKVDLEQRKWEDKTSKERLSATASSLGAISTLTASKNRELFMIGKAAAIAQATISTYQGIAKAWELGPILGPILAPLVAVAGFAQVANIASQQPPAFAQGGTVPGFGFGDNQLIRATPGEEVIDRSTSARFRDFMAKMEAGGGAGGGQMALEISLKDGLLDFIEVRILERLRTNTSHLSGAIQVAGAI